MNCGKKAAAKISSLGLLMPTRKAAAKGDHAAGFRGAVSVGESRDRRAPRLDAEKDQIGRAGILQHSKRSHGEQALTQRPSTR
jgi:hypothetical protein